MANEIEQIQRLLQNLQQREVAKVSKPKHNGLSFLEKQRLSDAWRKHAIKKSL